VRGIIGLWQRKFFDKNRRLCRFAALLFRKFYSDPRRRFAGREIEQEYLMIRKGLQAILFLAMAMVLTSCSTVNGVGTAVQGFGRDISWVAKQRVTITTAEPTYYSEIGGDRIYFKKVDDRFVRVAMR
jgi:predicted small secreted protein